MKDLLVEIETWRGLYEINFQFWPEQSSTFISKKGVEINYIQKYESLYT
jgi:hypothetical protein